MQCVSPDDVLLRGNAKSWEHFLPARINVYRDLFLRLWCLCTHILNCVCVPCALCGGSADNYNAPTTSKGTICLFKLVKSRVKNRSLSLQHLRRIYKFRPVNESEGHAWPGKHQWKSKAPFCSVLCHERIEPAFLWLCAHTITASQTHASFSALCSMRISWLALSIALYKTHIGRKCKVDFCCVSHSRRVVGVHSRWCKTLEKGQVPMRRQALCGLELGHLLKILKRHRKEFLAFS